jgi:pSer/pThr/pTyr-binding forkhead associated (FHA) protein
MDSFLALGIAIGSRQPWLLLLETGSVDIPSNLRGFDRLEYEALEDLNDVRSKALWEFLKLIMPSLSLDPNAKTEVKMPFWTSLDEWIYSQMEKTESAEKIEGRIRVIRFDGQKHIGNYFVPDIGLVVGRGEDCDIGIANHLVSNQHFTIIQGGKNTFMVMDLGSTHGTFLNKKRLVRHKPEKLSLWDEISIPGGYRFHIWDSKPIRLNQFIERKAPINRNAESAIVRIELPDIPVPNHFDSLDQGILLNVIHPDSSTVTTVEVQTYYPFKRIIDEFVSHMGFSRNKKYAFVFFGKLVEMKSTPLILELKNQTYVQIISMSSEV